MIFFISQCLYVGAGVDTTYFNLKKENRQPLRYIEIDFPTAINHKAAIIQKHKQLFDLCKKGTVLEQEEKHNDYKHSNYRKHQNVDLNNQQSNPKAMHSVPVVDHSNNQTQIQQSQRMSYTDYLLIGVDLRCIDDLNQQMKLHQVDTSLPTLFLSECVLIYMTPLESRAVIEWSCSSMWTGGSVFVSYEQILPFDAFGRTMIQNLQQRGCSLLGLEAFPDIPSQRQRYLSAGYTHYKGLDMNHIYSLYLDQNDVKRIEKIELFDEFEEWTLIQSHYHISMASKEPNQHQLNQEGKQRNSHDSKQILLHTIGILGLSDEILRSANSPIPFNRHRLSSTSSNSISNLTSSLHIRLHSSISNYQSPSHDSPSRLPQIDPNLIISHHFKPVNVAINDEHPTDQTFVPVPPDEAAIMGIEPKENTA